MSFVNIVRSLGPPGLLMRHMRRGYVTSPTTVSDDNGGDKTGFKLLVDITGQEIDKYGTIEEVEAEAELRDMAIILTNLTPETYKLWPKNSPLLKPQEELPPWGMIPKGANWEERFGRWQFGKWKAKQDKEIHIPCDSVDYIIHREIALLQSYIQRRKRVKLVFKPACSPYTDLPLDNEMRIINYMLKHVPDAAVETTGLRYYYHHTNIKDHKYIRVFPKNQLEFMPKWA